MLIWNPARSVWETNEILICGHSERFSGTWPSSGSMRSGVCLKRPPLVPLTGERECSSLLGLPTPTATYSGNSAEEHLRKKPGRTRVTDLRILVEEVGL